MTKSEKITSMISEKFFLPQYIYTDVYVKEGKLEKEFSFYKNDSNQIFSKSSELLLDRNKELLPVIVFQILK